MICAVIPTLNCEASLEPLLEQLRGHVDRIVISDGGSADQTLSIAIRYGAAIASGSAGRGQQLRRGAKWAQDCDWLLCLHADSSLSEDWLDKVQNHIGLHSGKAGYFDLRFDSRRLSARVLEILVRIRCALFGLPYGDQGLLISKRLYGDIGGYQNIPLFEDVALARTLGKGRLRRLGGPLLTSANKYERDGFYRRGWRNFRLLRRYLKGDTPNSLAKTYT